MRYWQTVYPFLISLALTAVTGIGPGLRSRGAPAAEPSLPAAGEGKVVAKVDGKAIYEDQLEGEVASQLRTFRQYGMRKESPELILRLRRRVLDKRIGDELVLRESRKLTIDDVDQRVSQRVAALREKHGPEQRFQMYLKRRRLTMDKLRASLRTRVYIDQYLKQHGILEPEIPEERIRAFYDRNPGNYSRDETVDVSHILIAVDAKASPAEKEDARRKAENLRKEILEGKDFAEMAREHSDCNSASGGGRLGPIKRGYMPKSFDEAAFALEKGAVSDVVPTRFGYHIIKVRDKTPSGVRPYEEVRGFIKKYLQEGESKKKLQAHIAELKKNADIEILLDESPSEHDDEAK